MKYFYFCFVVFSCFSVFANDLIDPPEPAVERVKMFNAPEGQQEMEELMNSVCEACNSGNFVSFMNCFTRKKAFSIKKTMQQLFSRHAVKMSIVSIEVIDSKDNLIQFKMQYTMDAETVQQKSILTSMCKSKKENGFWKIDSETLLNVENIDKFDPQDNQFDFGGAGQVVMNPNDDDFLPRDIAKRPGGCKDGRCNLNK